MFLHHCVHMNSGPHRGKRSFPGARVTGISKSPNIGARSQTWILYNMILTVEQSFQLTNGF